MAKRKEVFQSKVFQKLYPAAPTPGKEHIPPHTAEATQVKINTCREVSLGKAGKTKCAANPPRRVYTVLPPPPDYNIHSEISVTLPQLESITSTEDPAERNIQESSEELEEEKEAERQTRRRKRKRKSTPQNSEKDGTAVGESSTGPSQAPMDEGGERFSKNKRRKLKKKRHKEKMMSMGLMPRAAALEFTYHKDGEEKEEEEDNKRGVAELSDFLRTTTEIYMSDSSLHVVKVPHLSTTVDDLLDSLVSGHKPNSVLKQLCCLKAFAQQNKTDSLEKTLEELNNNPSMSTEETTAVVSLFKYWITDILPMQKDAKKTELSTAQP
ncbi:glutamate-rich protein 1 [Melanotaenia boesemani]|uniref:glutamate-rich protein 1 n=1 Tax=Melanotaenia boesemani TaxID=1250792 RepID=UPI001C045386|nr:glutamate-rich protein 1 [Melanotaenia boesemani]